MRKERTSKQVNERRAKEAEIRKKYIDVFCFREIQVQI